MTTCVKYQGGLPRFLLRGRCGESRRHPLPSTYQNSRLTEGKLAFSINHGIYTQKLSVQWTTLVSQGMVGALPSFNSSDVSQGLTLQVGLSRESALRHSRLTLSFPHTCTRPQWLNSGASWVMRKTVLLSDLPSVVSWHFLKNGTMDQTRAVSNKINVFYKLFINTC